MGKSSNFVHLHAHSSYSLLDGMGRIPDMVGEATEQGQPALAITDHGVMFGAISFYEQCQKAGIKPIIGCELYITPDMTVKEKGTPLWHLLLLAQDLDGYRNLMKLSTLGHTEGFYYKPRIDRQTLERHSAGLVCLSGCAAAELADAILKEDEAAAAGTIDFYAQTFPGRYFLELQDHGLEFDPAIIEGVTGWAKRTGLPLVATNDAHYVKASHAGAHEALLCVQTADKLSNPNRFSLTTHEFYLKSVDEMRTLFGGFPQALTNTLAVAEMCDLKLDLGRPQLPPADLPEGVASSNDYLRHLVYQGLEERYGTREGQPRAQADYELGVIAGTGFADYFLLIREVIAFARSRGIGCGPGRGSAAGSIVAYSLRLTNIDPIAYGLSFERFLNPERISMPDMDLDFEDARREEVVAFIRERYGDDKVANIIAIQTIGVRAGIRDVSRVLELPYKDADTFSKTVPPMAKHIDDALEESGPMAYFLREHPEMERVVDMVRDIEGVARNVSTHAAGVVITAEPLADLVPLYRVPKTGQVTTQYDMYSIDTLGLLKIDCLGLSTITAIKRTCAFIEEMRGEVIDWEQIDLHHPSIYELLRTGENFGVFQVDSEGMRKLMRDLLPDRFEEIVACVALYRPGPMQYLDDFVARKHGRQQVNYPHPAVEEILSDTYGIIVYQEQVMKIANVICGYSMGQADLLRKAMGKKIPEIMAKERKSFVESAVAKGCARPVAERIFDDIEPFAGYAFNRAHSTCYAALCAITAYLKANYPTEFMAGYFSTERDNADKVAAAIAECQRLRVPVLPPDINSSGVDFVLENARIRFGLSSIKGLGEGTVASILRERENGRFTDLADFFSRVDWANINKRVLDGLIRSGALDSLGTDRGILLANLERLAKYGMAWRKAKKDGKFDAFLAEKSAKLLELEPGEPATLAQKETWERELLGFALSHQALADLPDRIAAAGAKLPGEIPNPHGKKTRIGGIVSRVRPFTEKSGRTVTVCEVGWGRDLITALLPPRRQEAFASLLRESAQVVCSGRIDAVVGKPKLVIEAVEPLEAITGPTLMKTESPQEDTFYMRFDHDPVPSAPQTLRVEITRSGDRERDLEAVRKTYEFCRRFPGSDRLEIAVVSPAGVKTLDLPDPTVGLCRELEDALRGKIGASPITRVLCGPQEVAA